MADKKNIIKDSFNALPGAVKAGIWIAVTILLVLASLKLFKWAKDYLNKPADVKFGSDGKPIFDPAILSDSLHADIYASYLTPRNRDVYTQLLSLGDKEFVDVYNAWKNKYYTTDSETLPVAIAGESSFWDQLFGQQQKDLSARFQKLNLP